jgi:hypothetical protein
MDLLFLGITIIFFVGTWGLVRLCDRLSQSRGGQQ